MEIQKLAIKRLARIMLLLVLGVFGGPTQSLGQGTDSSLNQVMIETNLGEIVLILDPEKAPVTVENFLSYVDQQGYDGTIFHRVIPGFMIQAGGHFEDLSESPSRPPIKNEADNGLSNRIGTIAMARLSDIDTATNQFFINTANNARLDHGPKSCSREEEAKSAALRARGLMKPKRCKSFGYAVFGKVIRGLEVVRRIESLETGMRNGFSDVPLEAVKIITIWRVAHEKVFNP
ncbi:MAG: peptidylprolyl isomerase [Pseudomonadales bacterium]|nr:peptidylprolyl isomerase [Pseudomonadales bacterium]